MTGLLHPTPLPRADVGHNSGHEPVSQDNQSAQILRLFIERIERLEEEKKGMPDDIRDVHSEAKSQGFDPKIMRECVKLRKMDREARQEPEVLLDTDGTQLGMF